MGIRLRRAAGLGLIGLLFACSGEVPATPSPTPTTGPGVGRVVTAERIASSGARTAWEAIRLLGNLRLDVDSNGMPTGLSARGRTSIVMATPPKVVLNGVETEALFVLDQIPADEVVEIRYLSGPEGTTRYGTGSAHGVVVITTRGR